ncbi:MAG: DUF4192 family protein [Arachnia sp.]
MIHPSLRLRGTTETDLLAIPTIALGFHPKESCVAMAVREDRVEFCARLDKQWFVVDFAATAEQLANAHDQCRPCQMYLLGYGEDPEEIAASLSELWWVLADSVVAALITDGRRYWQLGAPGELDLSAAQPFVFEESSVAAQAVYQGVRVHQSRVEALRELGWGFEADEGCLARARAQLAEMTTQEWLNLLDDLLSSPAPPCHGEATLLAAVLEFPESLAEVLVQLSRASAPAVHPHLVAALRASDRQAAPNVLALLAMASWLNSQAAQHSECMEQLRHLDPGHPVLRLLARIDRLAIAPQRWEAELASPGWAVPGLAGRRGL